MRVPRVKFTVRQMIGLIIFVALILALVIQSARAARLERELAQYQVGWRRLLDELIDARKVIQRLRAAEGGKSGGGTGAEQPRPGPA